MNISTTSDNPAEERHGEEGYKREGQHCHYKKGSELVWGRHIWQHKGEGGLKEASERAPILLQLTSLTYWHSYRMDALNKSLTYNRNKTSLEYTHPTLIPYSNYLSLVYI